jgi:hypothetical protein
MWKLDLKRKMKTEMGLIREKGTNRRRKGKSDGRII